MDTDRIVHDWLLEHRPDGAEHDADQCPFCAREAASEKEEEKVSDKIFTQEQHEALLSAAVEKATAEAVAKVDAEILRLNEQLEQAQAELEAHKKRVAELEAAAEERAEKDRLEALATERAKLVRAVAKFSDEQIEARRMAWAQMSEEDFEAYIEDIKAVSAAAAKEGDGAPAKSAFDGTRETAGAEGSDFDVIAKFLGTAASIN